MRLINLWVMQAMLLAIVKADYNCANPSPFLTGSGGSNIFEQSGVREVENTLIAGTGYVDVISDSSKYLNANGNTLSEFVLFEYTKNGKYKDYTGNDKEVQIDSSTGRIYASTTNQYSETVYIEHGCQYDENYDMGSPTNNFPITITCCDCSSAVITAPSGFQTSYTVDKWDNDQRKVYIPSSYQSTEAVYNFRLRVEREGTGQNIHYESLTVTVTCTGASNTLQFGTKYSSSLASSQFVQVGTSTNYFLLPRYSNDFKGTYVSNPACANTINYALISSDGGSDNTYSNLVGPTLNGDSSFYMVVPSNVDADDLTYSFKWQATDSMAAPNVLVHQSVFYLHVGCPTAAAAEIIQQMETLSYTLEIGASGTPFTSGSPIQFQSLDLKQYTTCRVVSQYNQITVSNYVDTLSSGITQPTISQHSTSFSCTQSECGHLDVSTTDHVYSLDIQIQFKITGSDESKTPIMTFDSQIISLSVQCPSNLQLESSISNRNIFMEQNDVGTSTLSINHFTCQYPICCTFVASNYQIIYERNSPIKPSQTTQAYLSGDTEIGVSFNFDVSNDGTARFRIQATTSQGQTILSNIIKVIINPNCSPQPLQSTITNLQYYMEIGYTSNNTLSFDHFYCSSPICCTFSATTSYSINYLSGDLANPITCCQPVTDSSGFESGFSFIVDVSKQGTVIFQIQGTSAQDQTLSSQNIQLTVLSSQVSNSAPYFKKNPSCPAIEFNNSIQANELVYECQLGEVVVDNEGDIITISVSFSRPNLMTFQESIMTIFVKQSDISAQDIGIQTANFILSDDQGAQTITTVTIIIIQSEINNLQSLEIQENEPPVFKTQPSCPIIEIDFEAKLVYPLYRCDLGQVIDPNKGDTVSISAKIKNEKKIYFDASQMAIFVDLNLLEPFDTGIQSVYFTLSDDKEAETKTIISIMIKQPDIQQDQTKSLIKSIDNKVQIVQSNINETERNLSAKISSISNMGLVTVKFNQTMQTQTLNLTDINNKALEIYIEPRIIYEDYQKNQSNYNLTWNVTEFDENILKIQLYLEYPLKISPGVIQDVLNIRLKYPQNVTMFTSADSGKTLHQDWWHLKYGMGKQMELNDFNIQFEETAQQLNEYMIYLLILSILLFVFTHGKIAMQFMFILVRSLQMILHLPIFQILFPANAMLIVNSLIPLVGFDILEATVDWETQPLLLFDFEKHDLIKIDIYNQLVDIGYDTYNSLMLLQTLGLFLIIYFLQVFLLGLLKIFVIFTRNQFGGQEYCKSKQKELFFGPIIELFIQGYFEFLMAGILSFMLDQHVLSGEVFSNILGIFSLIVTLVLLPISLTVILFLKSELLQNESFQNRWGTLYSNLIDTKRYDDRFARAYFLIFVLRRIIYITVAFKLVDVQVYQILILIFMQIFMHLYQGINRPGPSRISNNFDLFNEFQVLICTQTIILFTDFIDTPDTQFLCGWAWVTYLTLTIIVNLSYIMYHSVRSIKLVILKYYRRLIYKICGSKDKSNNASKNKKEHNHQIEQIVSQQILLKEGFQYETKIKVSAKSSTKVLNQSIDKSDQTIDNNNNQQTKQEEVQQIQCQTQANVKAEKKDNLISSRFQKYRQKKVDMSKLYELTKQYKNVDLKENGNQNDQSKHISNNFQQDQSNNEISKYMSEINQNTLNRVNQTFQSYQSKEISQSDTIEQAQMKQNFDNRLKQINDKLLKSLNKKDKRSMRKQMKKMTVVNEEQNEENFSFQN